MGGFQDSDLCLQSLKRNKLLGGKTLTGKNKEFSLFRGRNVLNTALHAIQRMPFVMMTWPTYVNPNSFGS